MEGQGYADGQVQSPPGGRHHAQAGYLNPVEKVLSAHLGISLTARGITNYRDRLLAPAGSTKPKALLIPSLDSRTKLRRFPHMLPAVARTIIRDYDVIARLYAMTVDMECTLDDVTQRSPSKAAVKAERDETRDERDAARERVAVLEGGSPGSGMRLRCPIKNW